MRRSVVDGLLRKLDKDQQLRRTQFEKAPKYEGARYCDSVSLYSAVINPFLRRDGLFAVDEPYEPLLVSPFLLLHCMIMRYSEVVKWWPKIAQTCISEGTGSTWREDAFSYLCMEPGSTGTWPDKWAVRVQGMQNL